MLVIYVFIGAFPRVFSCRPIPRSSTQFGVEREKGPQNYYFCSGYLVKGDEEFGNSCIKKIGRKTHVSGVARLGKDAKVTLHRSRFLVVVTLYVRVRRHFRRNRCVNPRAYHHLSFLFCDPVPVKDDGRERQTFESYLRRLPQFAQPFRINPKRTSSMSSMLFIFIQITLKLSSIFAFLISFI